MLFVQGHEEDLRRGALLTGVSHDQGALSKAGCRILVGGSIPPLHQWSNCGCAEVEPPATGTERGISCGRRP